MSAVMIYPWRHPKRFVYGLLCAATPFFFACGSDSTQPNEVDRVEASVGPAGATVVTPSGAAGVQIPAGALTQTVTVTVAELSTPASPGSGPLTTNLKQYPPFYEFTVSPATAQFGDSVRVGVCQVTDPSSPFYAPESDHAKLKLAHAVGSTIEILKPVPVNDFLRCTGVTANIQSTGGWRARLGEIFDRTRAVASVRVAYAAHGGLGGKVKSFSPFGAVLDACGDSTAVTVGSTVSGNLEPTDCTLPEFGVTALDWFKLGLPTQAILRVVTTGTGMDVFMGALPDALADESEVLDYPSPTTQYAIVPAGNYLLAMYRLGTGGVSPYTLDLQQVQGISGCPQPNGTFVFILPNVSLNAALTTSDCRGSTPDVLVDHYELRGFAGRTYKVTASAGQAIRIEIGIPDGQGGATLVTTAATQSGSVSVTFQPPTDNNYVVNIIALTPEAYSMSVVKQ